MFVIALVYRKQPVEHVDLSEHRALFFRVEHRDIPDVVPFLQSLPAFCVVHYYSNIPCRYSPKQKVSR